MPQPHSEFFGSKRGYALLRFLLFSECLFGDSLQGLGESCSARKHPDGEPHLNFLTHPKSVRCTEVPRKIWI